MIYGLYVIKDEKVGFMQIMQDINDMTALRNFEFAMTARDDIYSHFDSDFKLYKLGTFDNLTGELVPCDMELLATGNQFVKKGVIHEVPHSVR